MSGPIDIRKKFLRLANEQLNPKMDSFAGLQQALVNWYCFQYNVPPNDDKLLSMTLEELLVLQQMHKLRDNPQLAEEINPEYQDYEEWLRQEMGDEYKNEEQMVKAAEELDLEEAALEKELPDVITTDFTQFGNEDS